MPNPNSPQQILAQIAAIQSMEAGKLSTYVPPGRPLGSGPYSKLQCWTNGKNRTRHVRPEELPALQKALGGYAQFCQLTNQYADLIISRTRIALAAGIKKKIQPYSRHSKKKSTG